VAGHRRIAAVDRDQDGGCRPSTPSRFQIRDEKKTESNDAAAEKFDQQDLTRSRRRAPVRPPSDDRGYTVPPAVAEQSVSRRA
jgi:hypothetical protein